MGDISTVFWKEWKEIRGGSGRSRFGLAVFMVVFGVVLPLQLKEGWVRSPLALAYWAWVPLFMVTSVIADSFAGERERHTLETLLATRLPDRAILLGKVTAALAYGLGVAWISLLLGVVTVNIAFGHGRILFYSPDLLLGIVLLGILFATLVAGIGILVSLRAATVRQAQQQLSIGIMVLMFLPLFAVRALPDAWRARAGLAFARTGLVSGLLLVALLVAVIDGLILAAAMARFRRSQLILD